MENGKQLAGEFLAENKIGVLCTISEGSKPHATLVYYLYEDPFTMYFLTKAETAKAKNILSNPEVALVVGIEDKPVTAQVYGVAESYEGENKTQVINNLIAKAQEGNYHWPPILDIKAGEPVLFKINITRVQFYDEREVDLPDNNYIEFDLPRE